MGPAGDRALDLLAAALALAILAGHAGWLHPALDSFSHLRPQLLGVGAVLASFALVRRRAPAPILLAVGIGSAALTAPYYVAETETEFAIGTRIVVLQQNLRYDNIRLDALERRVAERRPDLVALQEVRGEGERLLRRLSRDYPHQHRCRGASPVGDVAILSRHAIVRGTARCARGLAVATIEAPGATFTFGSLHLHWPWPAPQPRHLAAIEPLLGELSAPAILAGDFNAVPWSDAVRRIERAMGGRAVRGIGGTRIDPDWPAVLQPLWNLPIDQLVITPDVAVGPVAVLPLVGSDHASVVVTLSPPTTGGSIVAHANRREAATEWNASLAASLPNGTRAEPLHAPDIRLQPQ